MKFSPFFLFVASDRELEVHTSSKVFLCACKERSSGTVVGLDGGTNMGA